MENYATPIISGRSSSVIHVFDDDDDQYEDLQKDKYKDKDTETQKQTKTKCFQDPMYAIFLKSRGFKDI